MTDSTPNPKTFDLAGLLAGIEQPEDTVEVFLDKRVMYEIQKAQQTIRRATALKDEEALKAAEQAYKDLAEVGIKSRLVFHLRDTPRHVKKALRMKAERKHASEPNAWGMKIPSAEQEEYFTNLRWSSHIVKVVAADGAEGELSPEDVASFRDSAPDVSVKHIEDAINAFTLETEQGFETLSQEQGFLSQP